jgi:hypothetical protein
MFPPIISVLPSELAIGCGVDIGSEIELSVVPCAGACPEEFVAFALAPLFGDEFPNDELPKEEFPNDEFPDDDPPNEELPNEELPNEELFPEDVCGLPNNEPNPPPPPDAPVGCPSGPKGRLFRLPINCPLGPT